MLNPESFEILNNIMASSATSYTHTHTHKYQTTSITKCTVTLMYSHYLLSIHFCPILLKGNLKRTDTVKIFLNNAVICIMSFLKLII